MATIVCHHHSRPTNEAILGTGGETAATVRTTYTIFVLNGTANLRVLLKLHTNEMGLDLQAPWTTGAHDVRDGHRTELKSEIQAFELSRSSGSSSSLRDSREGGPKTSLMNEYIFG